MENNLGEKWDRLKIILKDGQIDVQIYDIVDVVLLLIEGVEQAVDLEYDIDMRYRVKEATGVIDKVLGL